jgi:hypothetical protein
LPPRTGGFWRAGGRAMKERFDVEETGLNAHHGPIFL